MTLAFPRALPVAGHHLRAFHAQLAHLAGRQKLAVFAQDGYIRGRNRQAN